MRIEDFIDATNQADTADEVFALFQRALADLGFDRCLYTSLGQSEVPAIARNYPDDWIAHYVESGYVQSDPARQQCAIARRPFLWSDLAAQLPRERALIFDEATAAGIRDGVGIGIHGPSGDSFGIGIASGAGGADPRAHLSTLHLLGLQFHIAYSGKFVPAKPLREVRLTPREAEILKWTAKGKSRHVVADILALSQHGVDFHLRNIFRKLDVSSTRMAVVKAIQIELIPLS